MLELSYLRSREGCADLYERKDIRLTFHDLELFFA